MGVRDATRSNRLTYLDRSPIELGREVSETESVRSSCTESSERGDDESSKEELIRYIPPRDFEAARSNSAIP
jgi:hypothetical protein